MQLLRFPIIQFTLYLIIGILIGYHLELSTITSIVLVIISSSLLFITYSIKNLSKTFLFSVLVFINFICIGLLTFNLHDEKRWSDHYTNVEHITSKAQHLEFRISKRLKSSSNYDKYEAEILRIDSTKTTGTILLNIEKDSTHKKLSVDDQYLTYASLNTIKPPLNPNQFNYKNYLSKKHIYLQLYTNKAHFFQAESSRNSIYGFAERLRIRVKTNLENSALQKDEVAIIQALLLGQKQDINKDIYDNFSKAGVIHILAVSGLHVGIILMILQFILQPLNRLKHGNSLKIVLILFLLWSFAIVAGLSPSVIRAVTMFSLVAIAMNLKRFTNIYNTLAISAFLLLLIKPMFLFEVGFQLSYAAVIAIVSIQPLLYRIISRPKYYLLNKLWEVFTVTLAAQIGVLPLSLFYFHQFPGLFFLSNLVIIPLLGLFLGLGLLVVVLAYFDALPDFMSISYGWIISSMNRFIEWISLQEQFLFQGISFDTLQLISSYVLILMLYQLIKSFHFKTLRLALIALLFFQCSFLYYQIQSNRNRFIIFNKNRHTLIGVQKHNVLGIAHNLDSLNPSTDYILSNFSIQNRIHIIGNDELRTVYQFKDKFILVIDSLGVYNVNSFKPEYILLRNSPKVNLNRLIDSLKPKQIIADASNYKSYVDRWKVTCRHKKIPFHSTYEKGAYIIN